MDRDEARRLARELMDAHGLGEWTLTFDRAKRRAGMCRSDRREISLSGPLTEVHSAAEVRDTVLHEIAHALVGPGHGHDAVWRREALRIGGSGRRCSSTAEPTIEGDWVGICPAAHRVTRHRRPARPMSCSRCLPTFDPAHLLEWTYRGEAVPMLAGYRAELARIRARARERPARTEPAAAPLRLGAQVRIVQPGSRYDGVRGVLLKRGRTRFHLRVGEQTLTVPFALVEPAA